MKIQTKIASIIFFICVITALFTLLCEHLLLSQMMDTTLYQGIFLILLLGMISILSLVIAKNISHPIIRLHRLSVRRPPHHLLPRHPGTEHRSGLDG